MEKFESLQVVERALLENETLDFASTRKRHLFERALSTCPPLDVPIDASRWRQRGENASCAELPRVTVRADVYDYRPTGGGAVDWWVNFADASLFFGWSTGLFAQDELMIVEHPALAGLRVRAERTNEIRPRTEGADERPTPVLVRGVPRRLAIDLAPRPEVGLPDGIYGRAFATASTAALDAVARPLDPPVPSNVLAMAAPEPRSGGYTRETIASILDVATAGFESVVSETHEVAPAPVVVHTGFWGCGAFGGDRELMIALQVLAAGSAGVDELVVHTVRAEGRADAEAGIATAEAVVGAGRPAAVAEALAAHGFRWGTSNRT